MKGMGNSVVSTLAPSLELEKLTANVVQRPKAATCFFTGSVSFSCISKQFTSSVRFSLNKFAMHGPYYRRAVNYTICSMQLK